MRHPLRSAALAVAAASVLGACSSTRIEGQWKDPAVTATPVGGAKVMAACQAAEQTVRLICQDRLAARLQAFGATIVPAPEGDLNREAYLTAARAAGAQSLVLAALMPVPSYGFDPGPTFGFGVGGGRGHVGTGVGVMFPIGSRNYSPEPPTYSADTSITNVQQGKPYWSTKVSATAQNELGYQIDQLLQTSLEAARKAGAL